MKALKNISIIASLLVTASLPAYAEVSSPGPTYTRDTKPVRSDVRFVPYTQAATSPLTSPGLGRARFAEQIKQRLDDRHQAMALQLVDRIKMINTNQTDRFTDHLQRLSLILNKISTRTNEVAQRGVNVTAVQTAITAAQTAIATAQAAVTAQAAKEYTVTTDTTQPVGLAIRTTVQQLRNDLDTLRTSSMEPARQAVIAAFQALVAVAPHPSASPIPSSSPFILNSSAAPTL